MGFTAFFWVFFVCFLKLPSMNLTASSPLKVRQDTQKETHLPTPGFQVRAVGFRVTVVMTKIWSNHSNHEGSGFCCRQFSQHSTESENWLFFRYLLALLLCLIHYKMNLELKKMPKTENMFKNCTMPSSHQKVDAEITLFAFWNFSLVHEKWSEPPLMIVNHQDGLHSRKKIGWNLKISPEVLLFVFFFSSCIKRTYPRHFFVGTFWVDDYFPTFLGGDLVEIFPGRYPYFVGSKNLVVEQPFLLSREKPPLRQLSATRAGRFGHVASLEVWHDTTDQEPEFALNHGTRRRCCCVFFCF